MKRWNHNILGIPKHLIIGIAKDEVLYGWRNIKCNFLHPSDMYFRWINIAVIIIIKI